MTVIKRSTVNFEIGVEGATLAELNRIYNLIREDGYEYSLDHFVKYAAEMGIYGHMLRNAKFFEDALKRRNGKEGDE